MSNISVLNAYCTCPAGRCGACCHIFAVLWLFWDARFSNHKFVVIDTRACTEKPQVWGIRKKKKKGTITAKMVDLILVKYIPDKDSKNIELLRKRKLNRGKIKAKLTSGILQKFVADLKAIGFLKSLVEGIETMQCIPLPEEEVIENEPVVTNPLFIPKETLWSDLYTKFKPKENFSYKFTECNLEQSQELEMMTREQSESKLWVEKRKTILSASNFGKVVKRRKEINEAFLKSLCPSRTNQSYSVSNSEPSSVNYMQMGLDNEEKATCKYLHVRKEFSCANCGLLVNPGIPCLGASPDRVVLDESDNVVGLLEIKTLSKCKSLNIPSLTEAIESGMATFLSCKNGFLSLKQNSDHYHQIQCQLAISGFPWCDLLVDGGIEFFIERMYFNEDFWMKTMAPNLLNFCFNYQKS